jgi:hypothetical protein
MEALRVLQVIERVPRTLAQDVEKVQAGAAITRRSRSRARR